MTLSDLEQPMIVQHSDSCFTRPITLYKFSGISNSHYAIFHTKR